MYVNKKICLLLVEFLIMVVCKAEHDHLDTMSSHVRSDYKADDENSCKKELRHCRNISYEILSRRIVNMLLSRIDFKEEMSWFNGRVELEGTASELETLKNFGLGISTLQEVAPILDDVIKTTEFNGVYECGLCLQSLTSQLLHFIRLHNEHIITIVLILYLALMLKERKVDFRKIVYMGFFFTFLVILSHAFIEIEQEEKIKEAPIHCRPDEMRWTDKIMALFASAKDCEKSATEMNNDLGRIVTLAIFRTLDRICGLFIALSIDIGFIIINLLAGFVWRLGHLIITLLIECSLTTLIALMLVLYFYHSLCVRRWQSRHRLNSAIGGEVFSVNPKRTRNRRRKQEYTMRW